ncbi:MAG: T9SS type A sorting domain-containing protein, partial [Candidatus Neomarinimicrobiota bacterium]|nr:T9SS type A sorting domain-containing protein [Candidatus Neomarinimicrobiota bacterium]
YTTAGLNDIIAKTISVSQAYPNPFNLGTRLDYYIDPELGDMDIVIDILDISGRRVQTLIDKKVSSGFHSVFWESKNRATGVYFIQLLTTDFISTQKIVLLK